MTMTTVTAQFAAATQAATAWAAAAAVGAAVAVVVWRLTPRIPGRRIGAGVGVGVAAGPQRGPRWRRHRSMAEPYAAFLDALARDLRIGAGLSGAFLDIATQHPSTHHVLGRTMDAVRDGRGLGQALVLASADADDADAAFVVQALRCVDSIGGPAAATLDAAASVLRERATVASDAMSHSAQARLSARVLTIVPLGFAGWGLLASEQTRRSSLASPLGALCIATGVTLNAVGWWWMRRIVGAAQPHGALTSDAVGSANTGRASRVVRR